MDKFTLLQIFIYLVFMFSIVAYATLDGFDLGVGCLHLFARSDTERRIMINSIGPVWDGNTTWIVIGGGILFAGFPRAFSTLMPNIYLPTMMLLFGYMLRGASVEFRSKRPEKAWRLVWDFCFFFASLLLALTIGLLLGNLIEGMALDRRGVVQGGFSSFLKPHSLLISLFGLTLFMMHGALYLLMKTEGALHAHFRCWVVRLVALFLVMWIITTGSTWMTQPRLVAPLLKHPSLWGFAIASFLSIFGIPFALYKKWDGWAFVSSCLSIVFLLILFLIGNFPYLLYSSLDAGASLTLFNSSASIKTLVVLAIIIVIGLPLSALYVPYLYQVFKGKIKLDNTSY